jgi:hypothetical protein
MSLELRKKNFIEKAIKIHDNKYDYSLVNYINSNHDVKIQCPDHGFFKLKPREHVNHRQKCPLCTKSNKSLKIKLTTQTFINESIKTHGNKYNYSKVNYKNTTTKNHIICPIHKLDFFQTKIQHIDRKNACPKCAKEKRIISRTLTFEQFVARAKQTHGDRYDYSKVKYTHSKQKVIIICPEHGEFSQTPNNHVEQFNHCPECTAIGTPTKELFNLKPHLKDIPATLYFVQFTSDDEIFYKIGITIKSIKHRFSSPEYNHYSITPIYSLNTTLYEAWQGEQSMLDSYSQYKYFPYNQFGGHTECFTSAVYRILQENA